MISRMILITMGFALLTGLAACGDDNPALGDRSIEVALSYDDGSNWGPTNATGLATIETASGIVAIDVQGLPALVDERYEGWLAGGGENAISTGKFNTDDTETGSSSITLGDISMRTYNRVVLTVEPDPDPSPEPDSRHSIGGPIPELP